MINGHNFQTYAFLGKIHISVPISSFNDTDSRTHFQPYASFISKAKKVVFVSFGTVADPKAMPAAWKQAFVELFE